MVVNAGLEDKMKNVIYNTAVYTLIFGYIGIIFLVLYKLTLQAI